MPLWCMASSTRRSRRHQELNTTALAVGSACFMAASSSSSADTWDNTQHHSGLFTAPFFMFFYEFLYTVDLLY